MKFIQLLLILFLLHFVSLAQTMVITGVVYSIDTVTVISNGNQTTIIESTPMIAAGMRLLKKEEDQFKYSKYTTFTDFDGIYKFEGEEMELSQYEFIELNCINDDTKIYKLTKNADTFFIFGKKDWNKDQVVTPYKPAIYLYPKKETLISVKHQFKGKIGTTYPTYDSGWQVIAKPNGSLLNLKDNRTYEYLFWDGEVVFPESHFQFKDGFVVNKPDYASFFQEKLAFIGLNNKEMNDFVVYWLPVLNKHKRCFIYFRINDNIDNSSILSVQPKPDTELRIFMEYKPVADDFSIEEQKLHPIIRKGFQLVEWGGSPIEQVSIIPDFAFEILLQS